MSALAAVRPWAVNGEPGNHDGIYALAAGAVNSSDNTPITRYFFIVSTSPRAFMMPTPKSCRNLDRVAPLGGPALREAECLAVRSTAGDRSHQCVVDLLGRVAG